MDNISPVIRDRPWVSNRAHYGHHYVTKPLPRSSVPRMWSFIDLRVNETHRTTTQYSTNGRVKESQVTDEWFDEKWTDADVVCLHEN